MTDSVPDRLRHPRGDAGRFRPLAGEPNPFADYPRTAGRVRGDVEYPLDGFGSERELADRVLERLEPWFIVTREVRGQHCSGRTLRVDAMLRPRDRDLWRDPDVAFGVEFKLPGSFTGTKSFTKWFAQAVDYTHVDWNGFGRRMVLTCPGMHLRVGETPEHPGGLGELWIVRRLGAQLGIGELVLRRSPGLTILFNDANIWSERYGVSNGKHWKLDVRHGSR